MIWFAVMLATMVGGFVQAITGFGCAVVMMVVFPQFFNMLQAPALTSAIAFGLSATMVWRFHRHIEPGKALPMAAVYVMVSTVVIRMARGLDLDLLNLVFGLFLVLLSLYYLFLSENMTVRPNLITALLCAGASGLFGGLFGVGGPLLVLYFIAISRDKESYIANLQIIFLISNITNTTTRILSGIYTWDLLPLTLLGIVGVNLGKMAGLRVLDRIDIVRMKKLVYLFIGVSGAINVINCLL